MHRNLEELPLIAALVAVALLPAWIGGVMALLGLWLVRAALRARPARIRKRAAALLALGAVLELAAGAVAGLSEWRSGGAERRLRASYAAFWTELGSDADRAVSTLADVSESSDSRQELFRAIEQVAGLSPSAAERTFLLFDRFGDLGAWRGPGLLHDLRSRRNQLGGVGVESGEGSVTPFAVRRLALDGVEGWRLVVGESFPRSGPPPGRGSERGRWSSPGWGLMPDGDSGLPQLELPGETVERPIVRSATVERLGALAIALGFGVMAAVTGVHGLLAAGRRLPAARRQAGPALIAMTAVAAAGLGAGAPATILAVTGVGAAVGGSRLGALAPAGAAVLAPALVVGPILLSATAWLPRQGAPLAETLWGSGDAVALRLAAAGLVYGAMAFGARFRRSRDRPDRPSRRELVFASAAAVVALLVVDRPVLVASLLAVAGLATALALAHGAQSRAAGRAAAAALALLIAGGAASAGERVVLRREVAVRVASLLPPTRATMEALHEKATRSIEALGRRLPSADQLAATGMRSDLAYTIWRDSALARGDLLSALTVISPHGALESFSFGLPIDAAGAIDRGPVRWVDLSPTAWRERGSAGEVVIQGREARPWRLRWAMVPRPGFAAEPEEAWSAPPRQAWRATRGRGPLPELPPATRGAIYDGDGRPIASSWIEGTPRPDPRWTAAPATSARRVLTPDGFAQVSSGVRDGVTAALFVPILSPLSALERGGTFATAIVLLLLAAGAASLVLALPARALRAVVRRTLASYSRRLVLVVSACLVVPLVGFYGLVAHSIERRLERQQEVAALEALRSAQRVLGEYALSLEPGFGVGTALDDPLLEWLARVIRNEIHLYWGSEIYASSKRDLFAAGLLPRRLSGEVWERLHLDGERLTRRITRTESEEYVEIYAPLEIPGLSADSTKLVLALPLIGRREELVSEITAVRRRALTSALAVAALVIAAGALAARRFTRPIEAIVEGTQRIAEGADALDYRPEETELEELALAIDRMAARIADGRRRLMIEKGLVERIVENVTAAVVGLDRDGRVQFANRLARSLLAATPGEPLARSLEAAGLEPAVAALSQATAASVPVSVRVAAADADREWTLVRIPLPGSGEPSELVVVEDVTDVVRAQRLDAWAAMARIIAHEIKNPLTPIRLSTEHLREAWTRDREHFESVFERCTTNILAQVEELRRTASEFSLYSEIPRIEPQKVDLREVVAEIVEGYRAAPTGAATMSLRLPGSAVEAQVDRRMLGRALRNLIENAVRVTGAGGEVEVALASDEGQAVIRVSDGGPGVPPELLGRILEPYFSTQAGGTGLGLPIARRVVEEHGGALTLRNRPSGGFEVAVTIPSS